MAEIDGVFSQHIEVPNPAAQREAVVEKSELVVPVVEHPARVPALDERIDRALATIPQSSFVEADPPTSAEEAVVPSESVFADLDSTMVEVGDLVFIRYDDQPDRRLSIRLSDKENDPRDGLVHVSQPLAAAILGASLEEQVMVKIGDRIRTAVIEKIEKLRPGQPLAAE
jgi:transcription elongation GreA/GreB family factor